MYLNKIIIVGNLTRDPEKKSLPNGTTVTSFAVAVNRTYKDKEGKKQEETEYINVVAFGVQADTIATYMKKGSQILVEGRMKTRSWDDKDGSKKYKTEIILETFQFGVGGNGVKKEVEKKPEPSKPQEGEEQIDYPDDDINPEDIPF